MNRCLEKNPEARFHSASDLAFALEAISGAAPNSSEAITAMTTPTTPELIRKSLPWILTVLFGLALIATLAFVLLYFRRSPAEVSTTTRFFISPPENSYFGGTFAVSPDLDERRGAASSVREQPEREANSQDRNEHYDSNNDGNNHQKRNSYFQCRNNKAELSHTDLCESVYV